MFVIVGSTFYLSEGHPVAANKIKLGLPGRDEEIETACELIRNMGKLGIPVWCYEWMPVLNWNIAKKSIKRIDTDRAKHFAALGIG